jgi:hypothetical protein
MTIEEKLEIKGREEKIPRDCDHPCLAAVAHAGDTRVEGAEMSGGVFPIYTGIDATRLINALEAESRELRATIKELSRNLKASNDEVLRLRTERDRLITKLEIARQEKCNLPLSLQEACRKSNAR